MTSAGAIGIAAALVVVAPWLIAPLAWWRSGPVPQRASNRQGWSFTLASALLYTLAFNLTFFIQELFLVLPKAVTPGLRPTLFHNNHTWAGDHPLAALFQGTGALATMVSGLACWLILRRHRGASTSVRLFLFWMAYSGLFMALPQVALGAVSNLSDVGMAMGQLGLSTATKTTLGLAALAAMPLIALRMTPQLLDLAGPADLIDTPRGRMRFVFGAATLPALIALPLIFAFRVPREWIEVAIVPAVVTIIGVAWIQAAAGWLRQVPAGTPRTAPAIAQPMAAALLLLLIFQLVLRPGIRF